MENLQISMKKIKDAIKNWINMKTDEGFMALHFAAFQGNIEIIELLILNIKDIL